MGEFTQRVDPDDSLSQILVDPTQFCYPVSFKFMLAYQPTLQNDYHIIISFDSNSYHATVKFHSSVKQKCLFGDVSSIVLVKVYRRMIAEVDNTVVAISVYRR